MSGWLSKATKPFARTEPEKPEPFEIVCACRNLVAGVRQKNSQTVRCPRCGISLFVLSRNPYPVPKAKSSGEKKGKKSSRAVKRSDKKVEQREVRERQPVKERVKRQADHVRSGTKSILQRTVKRQKALFTPFRLTVISILAIVAITGYWVWNADRMEKADADFKTYSERGEQAFGELNFTVASEELGRACAALDFLGRDDARARSIRQMFREATVADNLLPVSLMDIVADASVAAGRADSAWNEDFGARYGEDWIVLQTEVSLTAGNDGTKRLQFNFPLKYEKQPIRIVAQAEPASRLGAGADSRGVIVGARLESCRPNDSGNGEWVVTLNSDSLFLWTHFDVLVELGMTGDEIEQQEVLVALLKEQAELLEMAE